MVRNQSVSKVVRELIEEDLSIQDAIQRRYANYSAVARLLKPKVEERLGGRTGIESVITSVKRTKSIYHRPSEAILRVIAGSVINVRTDVAKLSAEKNRRVLDVVRKLLASYQEEFLQLSESISAVTLIFDQRLSDEIIEDFRKDEILEYSVDLGAIIVHSPPEIISTPGCAIAFYNRVSRGHINIEDTTSCYTDTIIVVRMDDLTRAFSALSDLVHDARTHTAKQKGRP